MKPTEKQCEWKGENKFRVICCQEAFSTKSTCKFAFCPHCAMDFREKSNEGKGQSRTKAGRRSSTRTKAVRGVAGADFPTGNCQKEGGGGVCGQHTLEDLLTLDHEQSSNTWLKRKREHETGSENIAEHCVKCGIRF